MKNAELNRLLVDAFPNLRTEYQEEVNWQEGDETGSHTVYGDVFTPYIINCIENNREKELYNIFKYLELLLTKDDAYINEVITFSVIESIEYLLKDNNTILKMLGKKTKAVLDELKNFEKM